MHESLGKTAACFQGIVFSTNRIRNKSLILFLTSSIEWQNATESNKSHTGPSFPLNSVVTLKWNDSLWTDSYIDCCFPSGSTLTLDSFSIYISRTTETLELNCKGKNPGILNKHNRYL